jgi:hypothetical protein
MMYFSDMFFSMGFFPEDRTSRKCTEFRVFRPTSGQHDRSHVVLAEEKEALASAPLFRRHQRAKNLCQGGQKGGQQGGQGGQGGQQTQEENDRERKRQEQEKGGQGGQQGGGGQQGQR